MFGNMPRWRLFKIWGHTVFMEPVFLVLIAVFSLGSVKSAVDLIPGLMIAPILFFGILWHELGHAIATKKMGYGNSQIVLQGLGGVAISQRPANSPPKKDALIAVMGPIFSLSIALVFGLIHKFAPIPEAGLLREFVAQMAILNLVWAIFNLLPINPLDGGHIMLAGFRAFFKNQRKAYLYTAYISIGLLVFLGLAASQYFGFMGGIIAIMIGYSNIQIIQQLK